jgi:large subunit ribosomal protein L25
MTATAQDTTLSVTLRTPEGTRAARRLRTEELIPAVVYGQGTEPTPVTVERRQLRLALSGAAGLNTVLALKVGDAAPKPAVVKELQRHPIRRTVSHVDFLLVDLDRAIEADVPLTLVGEPVELNRMAGMAEQLLATLRVSAKPAEMPTEIAVDISGLAVGGAIRVGDVVLPDGVTTSVNVETSVVVGSETRTTRQMLSGQGGQG